MKTIILKRMQAALIAFAIVLVSFPLTAVDVMARYTTVPNKCWTGGYTLVFSVEDLVEGIKNDPFGKFYLKEKEKIYETNQSKVSW